MNLELLLVLATLVTGLVWLADWLVLGPRRRQHAHNAAHPSRQSYRTMYDSANNRYKEPWYVEYARSFFPVLLIVLLLRSFVIEPFRIPSQSMMPTLLVGDFILVSKFAYGLRLPVTHTKLLDTGEPERGDVAVFRFPDDPSEDYIKRIIGLPGDRVRYVDKTLTINGKRIPQKALGEYDGAGAGESMDGVALREEDLKDAHHDILIEQRPSREGVYIVPPGHYFVMGDNRDNSNDSRYWGFVPERNLVGKAFVIWLNWDITGGSFDLGRVGEWIR